MRKLTFFLIASLPMLFLGCSKDALLNAPGAHDAALTFASEMEPPCGEPMVVNLIAGKYTPAGTVTTYNSENYVYVTFATQNGWVLKLTHLYVGHCGTIPTNKAGNPIIGQFPNQTPHDPFVTSFTYAFERDLFDECFCVAAHAEVLLLDDSGAVLQSETAWGEGLNFPGKNWAMFFEFCQQECIPTPPDAPVLCPDEQLRTQTQGGWGADPQGNNPAQFLLDNFATAFPTGLLIGCDFTIELTSAQAVADFLPQGGTPDALTQSYIDPAIDINVFAGQVTALALNVGFDAFFPDFGESDIPLANMYLGEGPLAGLTVAEILGIANEALGGCDISGYGFTIAEISDAVAMINENYVDGTENEGKLLCPPGYEAPTTPADVIDPAKP
jgi:hypothetical protein